MWKPNMKTLLTTAAAGAVVALLGCRQAQPGLSMPLAFGRAKTTMTVKASSPYAATPSDAWVSQSWKSADAPYKAIRQTIEQQVTRGGNVQSLLLNYKKQAQANPENAQKVFQWAYAAYQSIHTAPNMASEDYTNTVQSVHQILAQAPFPNTYDYARLIYIFDDDSPVLIPAGERLLAQNPNDSPVKMKLAANWSALAGMDHVYKHQTNVKAERRAITLAQELIKSEPKNARYQNLLGLIYSILYVSDKFQHPEYANKSIIAYQEYLRLAPSDVDRRSITGERNYIAQENIKEIREKLKGAKT